MKIHQTTECRTQRVRNAAKSGFTLVEVAIAAAIGVLVIGAFVVAYTEQLQIFQQQSVRNELQFNLQMAMERIRADLRLSSVGIGLMAFYPATGTTYTAISMPLAVDMDGDGLLDRDANGRILWNKTVVYHVRSGSPDELIRTEFSPRYADATPDEIYDQLETVVLAPNNAALANAAMTGEAYQTKTVFRNLVDMQFRPPADRFDSYAPARRKAPIYNWGSVVLDPGTHELEFKIVGKNSASSGTVHRIEIDRFSLSPSQSMREGEIFEPKFSHPGGTYFDYEISGGSVSVENMTPHGAAWSGNAQLVFTGDVGDSITFKVRNDLWTDTNFNRPAGVLASNCSVKLDFAYTSVYPNIPDVVVTMDKGTAWTASSCGAEQAQTVNVSYEMVVKNTIYGGTNNPNMTIVRNGAAARLYFQKDPSGSCYIDAVKLRDPQSGRVATFSFGGSSEIKMNPSGAPIAATDWKYLWDSGQLLEVHRDRNYEVEYIARPHAIGITNGLTQWVNADGVILSTTWPLGDPGSATNHAKLIGVSALEVGYPKQAVYRSGIFDTGVQDPDYVHLTWTQYENWPAGDIDIRIRSSNLPDMSDLTAADWRVARWGDDGYFQGNWMNSLASLPTKRYVQYEALFLCGQGGNLWAHTAPPQAVLRDVTISWDGKTGLSDLFVEFTRGPNGALIEARVNGQEFVKGIQVDLEIFKNTRQGMQSVSGILEVRPLNTGL